MTILMPSIGGAFFLTKQHELILDRSLFYLSQSNLGYLTTKEDEIVQLSRTHPYYSQMQHQMGVTKLLWCDFFAYTRHGYYLERVTFDEERWNKLQAAADFFSPSLLPQSLHPYQRN